MSKSFLKENKKHLVEAFNQKINRIHSTLYDNPYHMVADEVKRDFGTLLDTLQTDENQYYNQLRFFTQHRKFNSSLQKHIDKARAMLLHQPDEQQVLSSRI